MSSEPERALFDLHRAEVDRVDVDRLDFDELVARARALASAGERRILGITGAPGAGKSTLAARLVEVLDGQAVLVPMDGFHLADAELERLGSRDRKGAIDTFDVGGYLALLRRLREQSEQVVYAPVFRREIEDAIAGAIAVPKAVPLVVTEGNYLLVTAPGWADIAGCLDDSWFLELPEQLRLERLTLRHMAFGRERKVAEAWARGVDQVNAEVIAATRSRAALVVGG
jgi:pantothenate kinase